MLPLISVVLVILGVLSLRRLIAPIRKHRRQIRFIWETLASNRKLDDRRVIASLSTVPGRIGNLGPTIRSLLRQTRLPDEIVLAGSTAPCRCMMFLTGVKTTTMKQSRFSETLETSSPCTKVVYLCDGCGAATTERRRLPERPQHW